MQVILKVGNEKSNVRQIVLQQDTLIGRNQECQLKVASSQVSRRHCLISIRGQQVMLRDLNSSNGTQVNGITVPAEVDFPLTPGTHVRVGPLQFTVLYDLSGADLTPGLADTLDWKQFPTGAATAIAATSAVIANGQTRPPATTQPEIAAEAAVAGTSAALTVPVNLAEVGAQLQASPAETPAPPPETSATPVVYSSEAEEGFPEFTLQFSGESNVTAEPAEAVVPEAAPAPEPPRKRGLFDFLKLGSRKAPEAAVVSAPVAPVVPVVEVTVPEPMAAPEEVSGPAEDAVTIQVPSESPEPAAQADAFAPPESEDEGEETDEEDPLANFLQGFQP